VGSFHVDKGEIFCLLGPNGAGKTTLVKLLTGQLKKSDGEILVKGKDPFLDRRDLVKEFGLVPQEIALYEELTGRENLVFHAHLYDILSNEIDSRVNKLLKLAGLGIFNPTLQNIVKWIPFTYCFNLTKTTIFTSNRCRP